MSALFRPLDIYEDAPPARFDGLPSFEPWIAARGLWPSRHGPPGRSGRSGEPLLSDRWHPVWEAPLEETERPEALLVGEDAVYLESRGWRAAWDPDGRPIGNRGRGGHETLIDALGRRLLASEPERGRLYAHLLPDGKRDARIMLTHPTYATERLLAGPDRVLLLVSVGRSPPYPRPESVVEVARIRDWGKTKDGILYGLEPLAGVVREDDDVEVAAAQSGPVLATAAGVLWCDWKLRPLHEQPGAGEPLALSVDQAGRAYLTHRRPDDDGSAGLAIISPTSGRLCDHDLPWGADLAGEPALLSSDGCAYLTPAGQVMALDPRGRILWHRERPSQAPGSLSANCLVLLCDGELCAVSSDGNRTVLWRPPEPAATAAILARGRIHLATAGRLYVLEPVD